MTKAFSIGLVLTGLGILLLILSMAEFKTRQEVFRVGEFRASATTRKKLPALRYAGGAACGAGVLMMGMAGMRRK
jgi:hypothetical protein